MAKTSLEEARDIFGGRMEYCDHIDVAKFADQRVLDALRSLDECPDDEAEGANDLRKDLRQSIYTLESRVKEKS